MKTAINITSGVVSETKLNQDEQAQQALKLTEHLLKIEEYDAVQYQRDRASAYPSLADQADMQFHDAVDGTTTWKDAIQAVKDANPKPV